MVVFPIFCGLAVLTVKVLAEPPDLNFFNKFKQSDYKLKFERLEVVSFNKDLMKRFEIVTSKFNRTWTIANITMEINIDAGNKPEIIIQAYKFMSNEYRYFPIRVQVNGCFALSKNLAGTGDFLKCGNFTGCPLLKHKVLRVCNWAPDVSQFPPLIPDGRYMLEFQVLYELKEAAVFRAYGEVYRPIVL